MDQENNVKKMREAKMLSKTELARLAGISPLTLDRIEKGKDCRMATKRKILFALRFNHRTKADAFQAMIHVFIFEKVNLGFLNPLGAGDDYVALDIGSSSIKLVETVVDKNGYRVLKSRHSAAAGVRDPK